MPCPVPSTKNAVWYFREFRKPIAFSECPNDSGNMKDLTLPDLIQHFITSIYQFDPSGYQEELMTRICEPTRYRIFESETQGVSDLWSQTRDWYQLEHLYGARTGCAHSSDKV